MIGELLRTIPTLRPKHYVVEASSKMDARRLKFIVYRISSQTD